MAKSRSLQILLLISIVVLIDIGIRALWTNPVHEQQAALPQNESGKKEGAASLQPSKRDEIADLRREVSLLRQNLSSLEFQVTSLAMGQSSITSTSANEVPKQLSVEDEKLLAQKEKNQQQEHLLLINNSFDSEKVDSHWAKQATLAINNAISRSDKSQNRSDYMLKQAECHSSLCRIEITFQDNAALSNFQGEFHRNVGRSLPSMTMSANQNKDGTVTGVAYLVREGELFPE
jgi:hypothetical protein